MRAHVPLLALLLAGTVLAGCLGGGDETTTTDDAPGLTAVQDRHLLPFNVTHKWSQTLVEPLHGILEPLSVFLDVDLPVDEGGAAATGDARIHMGLWLPDIDGCDWDAAELAAACQVPVVADIGPYYGELDVAATSPAERLGGFLIENLVPQGYAVAQVSVFGTGQSNHCMDLMGRSEQIGIDAAVTWLGTQSWSNGNVGLIGRSYDGSTPYEAAMFGNPALKTIVPISGLIGMHELMWRNGSAEFRAPIMHNAYATYGVDSVYLSLFAVLGDDVTGAVGPGDPDPDDVYNLCKDIATNAAQGLGAYLTGDQFAPEVNDYWAERALLDRVLKNYDGSVYLIQGLQDWNVDPHMAFPTHQLLEDAGIEVKGLYGQWNHMYPDRPSEHVGTDPGRGREAFPHTVRFDWAQDLLEWFDHYLKGTGPKPALHAEVQDNQGAWRIEPTYPPQDVSWHRMTLDGATKLHAGYDILVGADARDEIEQDHNVLEYQFPAFADDTRVAGNVRLHATVVPTGPGGQVFAELYDKTDDLRLGHAIMDLRFAAGGNEMQPVTPGEPLLAKMEFQVMDVVIPAGHDLVLRLKPQGEGYRPSAITAPVQIDLAASTLKLPIQAPDESAFFTPVPWDVCTHPDIVDLAERDSDRGRRFAERMDADHGCSFTAA